MRTYKQMLMAIFVIDSILSIEVMYCFICVHSMLWYRNVLYCTGVTLWDLDFCLKKLFIAIIWEFYFTGFKGYLISKKIF